MFTYFLFPALVIPIINTLASIVLFDSKISLILNNLKLLKEPKGKKFFFFFKSFKELIAMHMGFKNTLARKKKTKEKKRKNMPD